MLQNWSQEKNCFQLIMQKVLWTVNSQQKWLRGFFHTECIVSSVSSHMRASTPKWHIYLPLKTLGTQTLPFSLLTQLHSAISIWKGVINSLHMDMVVCFCFIFLHTYKSSKDDFSFFFQERFLEFWVEIV